MRKKFKAIIFLAAFALSSNAYAQFFGDIFFENPSLAVEEGGEVTLRLAAFTGSDVFGSTQVEIAFKGGAFTLSELRFLGDMYGESEFDRSAGVLKIIAANGADMNRPTGIVPIAEITGTVNSQGGTVNVDAENRGMFLANRVEITNGALGAEILIREANVVATASHVAKQNNYILEAFPGSPLYNRAIRLRHEGETVRLQEPNGKFADVIILKQE